MPGPVLRSALLGFADAGRAGRLLALLWTALLLVALPAGLTVFESVRGAIGAHGVGESLRGAMDLVWLAEYREAAQGIAATVDAPVLTRTALLVNVEDWWRGDLIGSPAALLGLALLWGAIWTFATGIALDRFLFGPGSGAEAVSPGPGIRHFGRLARLALLSLPAYYGVYRLAAWLFPTLEAQLRDVTEERVVLAWYLAAAGGVWAILALVELWFDYARVVAVGREVESGRRALVLSGRWLAAHLRPALGLHLAMAGAGGAIVLAYLLLTPAPLESSWPGVLGVLALGQLAVLARLLVRLAGLAAQSRLYRSVRP